MKPKEIVERGILTFAEAALAVGVAAGTDFVNLATWKAAAIAGGAALLSFALNTVRAKRQQLGA